MEQIDLEYTAQHARAPILARRLSATVSVIGYIDVTVERVNRGRCESCHLVRRRYVLRADVRDPAGGFGGNSPRLCAGCLGIRP